MKRSITLIINLLCITLSVYGQYLSSDTILSRIWLQTNVFPQEKLYLQTDKVDYVAGETIWLRAFLTDAATHIPSYRSRYVYVELVNPFNVVEQRVRLRQDSLNIIHGHIALSSNLAGGDYSIRAYTHYMQSQGEDYFFRKPIRIISPYSKGLKMSAIWYGNNKLQVDFTNPSTGEPLEVGNTLLTTSKDTLYHKKIKTGIKADLESKQMPHRMVLLQVGNYGQYLPLPGDDTNYDLSFFPEGGQMVVGCMNKIAFKALNNLGLGEDVKGEIMTETGDTISTFSSSHKGMGYFNLTPLEGMKYIVKCRNGSGKEKTFHLPEAGENNRSLKIIRNKGTLYVSVLQSSLVAKPDSLLLIIHQRGIPKYAHLWDSSIEHLKFNLTEFENGIVHFLLAENNGRILSERLFFNDIHGQTASNASIESDELQPRSRIIMKLKAQTADGQPFNGNAAVSITDNHDVKPDISQSILSSLLLTSELKGHIEHPNWYFEEGESRKRQEALDQLMLTQGWRRYNIQEVIKGNIQHPESEYEESMTLKGRVMTNVLKKAVKNSQVRITAPQVGLIEVVNTDSNGCFHLKGFEFPDSTRYLVSAISKSKKDNVILEMQKEEYPKISHILPVHSESSNEEKYAYITKMENKMTLENGIRHIFMDEVIVTAPRIVLRTETQKVASKVVTEEKLEKSGAPTLSMALNSILGHYGRGGGAGYVLDGCELTDEEAVQILNWMPKEVFGQVELLRLPAAIRYFLGTRNVVILLYTKRGGTEYNASWNPSNLAYITPLGYQQQVEFYSPSYDIQGETTQTMDLRSTIYWKPDIQFKEGEAEISFYAADSPVDYSILVEGISHEGNLLRLQNQIK